MNGPDPQPSLRERMLQSGALLAMAASCLAVFGEVGLFRRSFGSRYFDGLRAAAPLAIIPIFTLFWPPDAHSHAAAGIGWLLLMWPFYLLRCLMHRVAGIWRRLRGGPIDLIHSRYDGQSILSRIFPGVSEQTIKVRLEPLVLVLTGLLVFTFSHALGWFLIWTAIGMGVHTGLMLRYHEQRARDMADAALDAEMLAERARELRGDAAGGISSKFFDREGRRNCRRRT